MPLRPCHGLLERSRERHAPISARGSFAKQLVSTTAGPQPICIAFLIKNTKVSANPNNLGRTADHAAFVELKDGDPSV